MAATWTVEIAAQATHAGLAGSALDRGDYRTAEELYRSLLRSDPSSPKLLNNLGIALHLQGKSSQAIAAFQQVLRREEVPGALALLGLNYCKVRQFDDALTILQRAKRYFDDPNVLSILAPCYLEAGDPLDAVRVYEELVERAVEPVDENTVGLARAMFRASKHFLSSLEKAPDNTEYMRAIEAVREDPSRDSRQAFGVAFRNAPDLKPGMSIREMGTLVARRPSDPALLYVLGVVCGEKAIKTFLGCRKRYEGSTAVRRLYAEMLAFQGRNHEAVTEYQALMRTRSVGPELHHDLAMLYRGLGEWQEALQQFELERRANPESEQALVGISECLLRLGRFEKLSETLKPVLAAKEPPEWALLDAAWAEQQLGRLDEAIRYLHSGVVRYSDNPMIHYRLSRLYILTGKADLARQEMTIFQRLKGEEAGK